MKTKEELIERMKELEVKASILIDDIQLEQRFGKKAKVRALKNMWLLADNEIKIIKWVLKEE